MDDFLSNPNPPPQADEEKPMFALEKVEYKPNGLKYMAVNNNVLVMALNLPRIFNTDNKNPYIMLCHYLILFDTNHISFVSI